MRIYVNANAGRDGNGTANMPFRHINDAAKVAKAGDEVLVSPGVYREYVNPIHAGEEDARISYRSTQPLGAVITGAEQVKSWQKYEGNVWVCRIANSIFGNYNPYTTVVYGDWYFAKADKHTGCVYLNDKALYEAVSLEECMKGEVYECSWVPEDSIYKWYTEQDEEKDNAISILEYHIQDDRMIIDILEQSKKRIYDHYLDYVSSSKSTVFEEDKQKIVDLFTQKINGPIIYREYYRGSQEYCVKTLDATVIYNSNDEAEIILATASDITVNWHEQNSLKQQAQRDSLTHLYNLEAGKYIIDEYIKKNPKQQNALIVLDIDHFKEVNDTYGHLVGNELLIALAKYLLFHTNPNDIVIRMGGDEFVVFFKNVHDDLTYPCNQLMSHLNEISLSHHGIHFSISMGVYTFSNEQNFDNIFKIADDALYHSKRNGRNRYTIKYQK